MCKSTRKIQWEHEVRASGNWEGSTSFQFKDS